MNFSTDKERLERAAAEASQKNWEAVIQRLRPILNSPSSRLADISARQRTADAFVHLNQTDEAENILRAAMQRYPESTKFYLSLGGILEERNDTHEAEALYINALSEVTSNKLWLYIRLAELYFNQRRWLEVVDFLEQIDLDQLPDRQQSNCREMVASSLKNLGKYDLAVEQFDKAVELNPKRVKNYVDLGKLLEESSNWKDAANVYRKGLAQTPQANVLNQHLGNCLFEMEQYQDALTHFIDFKKNCNSNFTGFSRLFEKIGSCYFHLGDNIEAVTNYIEAIKKNPRAEHIFAKLSALALKVGNNVAADAFENKVLPSEFLSNYRITTLSVSQLNSKFDAKLSIKRIKDGFSKLIDAPNYLTQTHYALEIDNWYECASKKPDGKIQLHTEPLNLYRIPKGQYFNNNGQFIIRNEEGAVIEDLSSDGWQTFLLNASIPKTKYFPGTAVVMLDTFIGKNYCHWSLDWIPRLGLYIQHCQFDHVLVYALDSTFKNEMLETMGISAEKIIEVKNNPGIKTDELVLLSNINFAKHPLYYGSDWAADFLRDNTVFSASSTTKRKIYVSRSIAKYRFITNEYELVNAISKLGFETLILENMNVKDQAQYFSEAEIVVGLHGAGLTNLVYCRPGTKVIEIFDASYGTPSYYMTSMACGLNYYALVSGKDPDFYSSNTTTKYLKNPGSGGNNVTVDSKKLVSFLQYINA